MTSIPGPSSERQSAYENRFDLKAMFEFSNVISASLDLKFILGHLLLTIMGKLLSLRGIVLLRRTGESFRVETVKGFTGNLAGSELTIDKIPRRLMYVEKEDGRKFPWIKYFKDNGIHIVVPLCVREQVAGIAGFASSVRRHKLGIKEEEYIKSLCNIAASAIEKGMMLEESRQLNRHIDRKFQELNTLFELGKEFNAVLDADRLVRLLLFSVMGQVGASKHLLCLERHGALEVVSSRLDGPPKPELLRYLQGLASPVLVDSLTRKQDREWKEFLDRAGITVLIPLQIQSQTKGILGLGERIRGEKYTQTDLEFLSSLGNLAMISLENARLFKEAIEKQKLEDELVIANEIQRGLLPKSLPRIPHFDLAAINISSKQVGGDYYDIILLGENKFVLAIGDVSGKGTPASLLMANLQATIRALVPLGLSLSDLTQRVNDLICENTSPGRFITFFWAIVDVESRNVRYVSAGHNPPFLFRANGTIERLEKGGIILGIMKTAHPYEEGECVLSQGDVLVLFTDGVSESMNLRDEELGEQSIVEAAKSSLHLDALEILAGIVERVKRHSENTFQSDDITLVVMKVLD
jgi:sigma-B regulation protein RsbU (phosphoserine phosphatase)